MNIGKNLTEDIEQPIYMNIYHPIDKEIINSTNIKDYIFTFNKIRTEVFIPIMNIVTIGNAL
jgi:hypothetical protein